MIDKKCEACDKSFSVRPYRNNTARFCSFRCHGKLQRKGVQLSPSHKDKLLQGRSRYTYTPDMRAKMSQIKKSQYSEGVTPWNKGKKMTEEYGRTIAETLRGKTGEQSRNWKGGLNPMWVRKLRIRQNGGSHTLTEWNILKAQYNWTCPRCKQQKELTKDHIIPISKGGSDNIENIQPLCRNCNSQKHKQEDKFEY